MVKNYFLKMLFKNVLKIIKVWVINIQFLKKKKKQAKYAKKKTTKYELITH